MATRVQSQAKRLKPAGRVPFVIARMRQAAVAVDVCHFRAIANLRATLRCTGDHDNDDYYELAATCRLAPCIHLCKKNIISDPITEPDGNPCTVCAHP